MMFIRECLRGMVMEEIFNYWMNLCVGYIGSCKFGKCCLGKKCWFGGEMYDVVLLGC